MKRLTLAYFGTPYFSARFLEKLVTDPLTNRLIEIKLVITQPDRPVGRKQILTPAPVKLTAKKFAIPVWDKEDTFKLKQIDLALLFAFGQIIAKELLSIPKFGFLNIHPSLLPQYRGPSPIAYPLILGEKKTGVTIIKMDEKIDHGPIIAQEELPILLTDRRPDLEVKLTDLAFKMFKKTVNQLTGLSVNKSTKATQRLTFKTQPHKSATDTRLLKRGDGFIPFSVIKKSLTNQPIRFTELPKIVKQYLKKYPGQKEVFLKRTLNLSLLTFNLFRGLYPWPGVWTILPNGKRLKITDMTLSTAKNSPVLKLKKVQLEGKKEVNFEVFNQAYHFFKW